MNLVRGFNLFGGNEMNSVTPDIVYDHQTLPYKDRVSMICRTKQEAEDIVKWFGHEDFCPVLPILLCIPGGWGQMAGEGIAPASELRDECIARWELQEERIAKTGGTFDFEAAREKAGFMPFDKVADAMRNAADDKIREHKANAVTNNGQVLVWPRWNGKTVFATPDRQDWKSN